MEAHIGDELVVKGHHFDDPPHHAEILEVQGAGGTTPFVVRWSRDGHVGLVFPGPDAHVAHVGPTCASGDPSTAS